MKKISIFICLLAVLFVINIAYADLYNRGTDNAGNRLIYDTDLDVTWYDYSSDDTWWNQMDWADALSVTFGSNVYDDWRLPTALNQDGSGPCYGYNCIMNEMGHLYYVELGNSADGPLSNTGDFQNLQSRAYWTSTEYSGDDAWNFSLRDGGLDYVGKTHNNRSALAVRDGDVLLLEDIDDDGDGYTENEGDCDDNDPTVNPGAIEVCDGIDNNCVNGIDEDFNVGEICYSLPNSCGDYSTGSFICTSDGSGAECDAIQPDERAGYGDSCVSAPNNCGDTNAGVVVCAGAGIECDAATPDDGPQATAYIDADGDGYGDISSPVDATCGMPAGAVNNSLDCNDTDSSIYPNAPEIKHDGIDQDCNGYDLTIDIIKADYKKDKLRVEATSSLGETANLILQDFGSMKAKKWRAGIVKWVIKVKHIGGNPGTATVCGPEGCDSVKITISKK